ncbi:Hsp70 family protein [Roseococcus sp. YIM B11640]|uniref:Hsp70 family protein n=1 Tax=Roseococcus sp. YIM B11640 TaxID=3133973 RepID=UPI003C7A6B4C
MSPVIGIDFGTTNSVVTALRPDGTARVLTHDTGEIFRTVLCFWLDPDGRQRQAAGPRAIDAYLDDPFDSRLIMSMKSHLAQRSFTETRILGRAWTLEQLVAAFLRHLLAPFAGELDGARVVVGRPVHFVGETADDVLGAERLRAGFAAAGLSDVHLALEPAAAGHRFAQTLDAPATVLVADFGGGTSDFSLLRFEPGPPRRVTALGHSGLGIAGDAFDFRIMDHVVSPLLGKGGTYRPFDTDLPIPPAWYAQFARWHLLSLMRAPKTLRDIADVMRYAAAPERLGHLLHLIEDEAGYALSRAVSGAKAALSSRSSTSLSFRHGDFEIEAEITRAEFESWIAPELRGITAAVDAALSDAALRPDEVDRVFLTGGTSLVPAVRRLFEQRFGAAKVVAGGEFVSVAEGLALIGRD